MNVINTCTFLTSLHFLKLYKNNFKIIQNISYKKRKEQMNEFIDIKIIIHDATPLSLL